MSWQWAFEEMEVREREDSRFPPDIAEGHPLWPAFCEMKYQRARRRKRERLTRAEAHDWVAEARKAAGRGNGEPE